MKARLEAAIFSLLEWNSEAARCQLLTSNFGGIRDFLFRGLAVESADGNRGTGNADSRNASNACRDWYKPIGLPLWQMKELNFHRLKLQFGQSQSCCSRRVGPAANRMLSRLYTYIDGGEWSWPGVSALGHLSSHHFGCFFSNGTHLGCSCWMLNNGVWIRCLVVGCFRTKCDIEKKSNYRGDNLCEKVRPIGWVT